MSYLKKNGIDIFSPDDSVGSKSMELLKLLKDGEISIADLMGPLSGVKGRTPVYTLPPGQKEYAHAAPSEHFLPNDEHNSMLNENIHPPNYQNPTPTDEPYDLVVIGAGVTGLISVIVGAWLGKKCALIERHGMGGDCLNIGCVPSKALIACARAAHSVKNLKDFGVMIPEGEVKIDFGHVMSRMREIRARISHHDSVQRYAKEFCKHVYIGNAKFIGGHNIEIIGDDQQSRIVSFKKAMIATGASASIPPVPGLRDIPHLTNANFFNLTEKPPRLLVIGSGPIGLEISQAMRRLGSEVYCFEGGSRLLPREDPDATDLLYKQLLEDGVHMFINVMIERIECKASSSSNLYNAPWHEYKVSVKINGEMKEFFGDALLNATGRTPNVYGLGLETVNVDWDNRAGVHINEYYQTANPDIYACGDCSTVYKFTHSVDFQARAAVRNMFLGENNKLSDLLIPWCTYTEPEIAHVGNYEDELRKQGVEYESFTRQLKDVDRCICEGIAQGFAKITVRAGTSEILGATICGPNAGDMITEVTMAMQYGLSVPDIAGIIHPYPTTQECVRQACLGFNKYFKNPNGVPLATLKLLMKEKEEAVEKSEATGST
jgi:pyruvate/2-oxoglutarate dehydrogenase complex dihydrolipoamide dehydrogenase (E3) component